MTLEEAYALLGASPDDDDLSVRRAYLRQVRAYKPDTDPDGFMALRAAYDLVLAQRSGQPAPSSRDLSSSLFERRATEPQPPAPPALPQEEEEEEEEEEVLPVGGDSEAPQHEQQQEIASYQQRIRMVGLDFELRIEIARQAYEELPENPAALWLYVQELEHGGQDSARTILRTGYERGISGCFERLIGRYPSSLTDDERERVRSSQDPNLLLLLALGHIEEEAWQEAAALLERALTVATASLQGSPATEAEDAAAMTTAVRAILLLHACRQTESARRARLELLQAMEPLGGESQVLLGGEAIAAWVFLNELDQLDDRFAPSLRTAIAKAIVRGHPEAALDPIHSFAIENPGSGAAMADILAPLPLLASYFVDHLEVPLQVATERRSETVRGFGWRLLWMALILVPGLAKTCDRMPNRPRNPYSGTDGVVTLGLSLLEPHCPLGTDDERCVKARTFLATLETRGCRYARAALAELAAPLHVETECVAPGCEPTPVSLPPEVVAKVLGPSFTALCGVQALPPPLRPGTR